MSGRCLEGVWKVTRMVRRVTWMVWILTMVVSIVNRIVRIVDGMVRIVTRMARLRVSFPCKSGIYSAGQKKTHSTKRLFFGPQMTFIYNFLFQLFEDGNL